MGLIDQKARDQALDPARSFIVQAPAGSGKTGLLVRRLIALLCVVDKPEEILAITFTRKATAEMRDRVIGVLSTAKSGGKFEDYEQDMANDALRALARNQQKQWRLLEQPQRLRIQTIDSLCTELVRKMPWSTRFGAVPQIETNLQMLYTRAAQELLKKMDTVELQASLSVLLANSNGKLQALQGRLANMLYQREKWLKLIFLDHALESRDQIQQNWQAVVAQLLAKLETECGDELARELLELRRYAEENSPRQQLLEGKALAALNDESSKPGPGTRAIQWRLIAELLFRVDGQFRKTINRNNGFPFKDKHKNRMLEILGDLQEEHELHTAYVNFLDAPDPEIRADEWQLLLALRKVLPALAQELYVLMVENNCTDYDELSRRAVDALGTPEQPTDLALLQDYRIRHILMDEFQDTSESQHELLERLTGGWQHEEADRSLFLVGDPMQSIYGFRNADVRVFLEVRDQGINDIHPEFLELKVNFRSSPDIIDWVNRVMIKVFPDEDLPDLAKVRYSRSSAQLKHKGSIHTHLCVADSEQNVDDYRYCEAREIRDHICAINLADPGASIAILARKRAPLASLAEILRKSAIEFESVGLETLSEQSVVQDLISLAGVFINPMDRLAWMSVLRAPWCGLTLKDLTVLGSSRHPVSELLLNENPGEKMSLEGTSRLNGMREKLAPILALGSQIILADRLRRAWFSLRGPACYDEPEMVHVEAFFEMLNLLESSPLPMSRERLLEASKLHSSSSPAHRIQLMTIHKAKGLEFDHVILMGLAGVSTGDQRLQPLLQGVRGKDTQLVASSPSTSEPGSTKAGFIRRQLQSIENEELARLLYVAVTRARKHLALFATLKRAKNDELQSPRKGSLLSLLWPELEDSFTLTKNHSEVSINAPIPDEDGRRTAGIPLRSLPPILPPLTLPEPVKYAPEETNSTRPEIEFDWAQEEARIVGLVIHAVLEHTDAEKLQNVFSSLDRKIIDAKLKQSGISQERIEGARKRVRMILHSMSKDKRAQWLFDPGHRHIQSEWALSCARDDQVSHYIIDRSFVDQAGIRWIIDFKTSSHEGANLEVFLDEEEKRYAQQLNQYAALVGALEPDRKIRIGLYFPALGRWRERGYQP